jgi:hypothetical protein
MRDKPIFRTEGELGVLLDTRSLDALLSSGGGRPALRLLEYHSSSPYEFTRSPFRTGHAELDRVVAFDWKYDAANLVNGLEIKRPHTTRTIALTSDTSGLFGLVLMYGRTVFGKDSLDDAEREAILLVLVGRALSDRDLPCLLVTANAPILRHRLILENKVGGQGLTSPFIVTAEEALEILDLYAKFQGRHLIGPSTSASKWYWYWLMFRNLVPHHRVGNQFQNAFASRFGFLLMSLDEIGFRYYAPATNTAMTDTVYHFNYGITLTTGIFDSLALIAKERLGIKLEDDRPERTSLNPRSGKEFLQALEKKNTALRKHINDFVVFIQLIYGLRELVVHRGMLEEAAFEHANDKWKANLLRIDDQTFQLIRQVKDKPTPYEPFTMWGTYTAAGDGFLEPFHFTRSATPVLAAFSDRFLDLLGYGNFLVELEAAKPDPSDPFRENMQLFQEKGLRSVENRGDK